MSRLLRVVTASRENTSGARHQRRELPRFRQRSHLNRLFIGLGPDEPFSPSIHCSSQPALARSACAIAPVLSCKCAGVTSQICIVDQPATIAEVIDQDSTCNHYIPKKYDVKMTRVSEAGGRSGTSRQRFKGRQELSTSTPIKSTVTSHH